MQFLSSRLYILPERASLKVFALDIIHFYIMLTKLNFYQNLIYLKILYCSNSTNFQLYLRYGSGMCTCFQATSIMNSCFGIHSFLFVQVALLIKSFIFNLLSVLTDKPETQ